MKKLPLYFALISISILFIFSCKKEKDDVATVNYGSSNGLRTTVTGMVLDESNAPLSGVAVTAYGQTTSTNQHGTFVLKNINANKNRCVVQFSKTGFFKRAHGFMAAANTVNYVRIVLISNAASQNFSSAVGGTVSLTDGSSVNFQPNSFVTASGNSYAGTVNLAVSHLSPGDANFGFTIPGGDLTGVNAGNQNVALYSYGMLGVELTGSSGEPLQLATGTTAALTFPIAASQLSSAPATIPLWFFDEATSLWKEEGSATKVGNNYVGTVSHFSWWNIDVPGEWATITGKVMDCENMALPNVIVTIIASNGYSISTVTNQNGVYQLTIASGFSSTVQVLINNNQWLSQNSQLENVPALTANQTYTVPDLIVQCPTKVEGTIQTCSGQNTSAYVTISDGMNFFACQYTTSGSFSIAVIPNAQFQLNINSFNTYHNQTITSLSSPLILNVGNILLCDSISSTANNITINGGPFSNQLFNITPNNAIGTVDIGETWIDISGVSYPYSIQIWDFYMIGDVPGTYSGYIELTMTNTLNQNDYWWISMSTMGTFNLTQLDTIGGRIKGNFVQPCYMDNDTSSYPCTLSGNFDVLRVY